MGYRHYFCRCKKSDVAAIRDKTLEELEVYAKELGTDLYFFNEKLFPINEVFVLVNCITKILVNVFTKQELLCFQTHKLWKISSPTFSLTK